MESRLPRKQLRPNGLQGSSPWRSVQDYWQCSSEVERRSEKAGVISSILIIAIRTRLAATLACAPHWAVVRAAVRYQTARSTW